MNDKSIPAVEVVRSRYAFLGDWRDWFVELVGGVRLSRLTALEQRFEAFQLESRNRFQESEAKNRQNLTDSNAALMTLLAVLGVEPGELNGILKATMEEAWERAESWQDRAEALMVMVREANSNKDMATAVAEKVATVFEWAPLAQESLLDLTLPEVPAVSD